MSCSATDETCKWLHSILENKPLIKYPFNLEQLPRNGIYFFYEENEYWGHGGNIPRIVRVGTHRSDNFRSRINEHFLMDNRWMDFDSKSPAPKDRSIFRKNIGRAIINKENPDYFEVWNIDFTTRKNREAYSHLRDLDYEKTIETKITDTLRNKFSFRYIEIKDEEMRLGEKGLERHLIGSLANCSQCRPTENWLGLDSPKPKIRKSGLWQVQHLRSSPLTSKDMVKIKKICN